jgi:pyrroloquinoline quinone biosynthesis protein B
MRLIVLGTAQDGGLPHVGCRCTMCNAARTDPGLRRLAPSVAIVDKETRRAWMVDASPDLPEQLEIIRGEMGVLDTTGIPLSAVLLTHIHMGHYWGLGHFGKEGMMPRGLLVLSPPGASTYLRQNRPFKDLVAYGALDVQSVRSGDDVPLTEGLRATPVGVEHREDFSDTVAWLFEGPIHSILYAPDMDRIDEVMVDLIASVDVAFVDGTFYSGDEVPGAMGTVPHPPVGTTMAQLKGAVEGGTRVIYTHLNHTNPMCDPDALETQTVTSAGFEIASEGMTLDI